MALAGLRVVDLTRILAGPFCTRLLADMGAEVIKVETDAGDPVRGQGTLREGLSWYFVEFNRNKKSIVLDLYTDSGKQALAALIKSADILVENFRPGVLDKMGFSTAVLEALNPGLVVASVNGYGSTGPYVDRPSFDFIAQAMSGFMSANGDPNGPPMRAAPPISDLIAGLYAAFGIVNAIAARERSPEGRGQRVETSLTGGLISMLGFLSAEYFATGQVPARTGNDHALVWPYGLFEASDGSIAVAPSNDTFVERFLKALGLESLLNDERYASNDARLAHRELLREEIHRRTRTRTVAHWIDRINEYGCPCGRVMDLDEVFTDPQVLAQQMVLDIPHGKFGTVKTTGFPVKLSATPATVRRPAPQLGEHTEEVLAELDLQSVATLFDTLDAP
ncbi:MAG: CoA transferase [Gammaproteobacteria bacterium]|nr:CoA transferase [Gammaproteobacteria bacterium]